MTIKIDHFQTLRGIACLMVVFNHLGGVLVPALTASAPWYATLMVPAGFPWVWLFLALSGFLLTKAFDSGRFQLNRKGIKAFYIARFQRLFPLLWFSAGLWAMLYFSLNHFGYWPGGLNWDAIREINVAFAFPWVVYSDTLSPVMSANSPVWSVVIEIHFCLLMPLLLLKLKTLTQKMALLVLWVGFMAFLLIIVSILGRPTIFPNVYSAHLYNFGFFYIGMLLAHFHVKPGYIEALGWWTITCIGLIALVVTQYLAAYDLNLGLALSPFIMVPAICMTIIKSDSSYQMKTPKSLAEAVPFRFSLLRTLEGIGVMSYSVYLLHKPLGYIAFQFISPIGAHSNIAEYFFKMLIFLFPFLLISSLAFFYVENRFRYKHKLTSNILNAAAVIPAPGGAAHGRLD